MLHSLERSFHPHFEPEVPTMRSPRRTRVFTTATLFVFALAVAATATAQQPAAPAPAWKQGQPAEMATSPLAPVPAPPSPTPAAQIQLGKIKLPQGFKISVWADGMHNARQMSWGDKGTLFVGSRVAGQVYAVVDQNGKRTHKVIAKGLTQPNGMAFK